MWTIIWDSKCDKWFGTQMWRIIWDSKFYLQMVCCPELRPFTLHGKETAWYQEITVSHLSIVESKIVTWPDSLVMLVGCERIAKEEAGLGAGPGRQSWRSRGSSMSTPLSCSNAARCSQFIIKCRQKDTRAGGATCQRCSPSLWLSVGVPARALTSQSFQPQEDMDGGRLNFKFLQVSISNRQMFFITLLCSGEC